MLGLVDVEDADTPGLIAVESDLAYHLIDLTLGGDAGQAPEPVARPFTAIDMALCRLHLDAILAAFGHAIGANLGRPLTKGLTIRDLRQNLSQLRLAPDYIDVMVFGMTLGLGEAGRRGRFQLILPLSALDVIRASIQVRNARRRARPPERPLEDADAPRRGQRAGAGRRGAAPPAPEPRRPAGAAGRAGAGDPAPVGRGDPARPSRSPAAAPRCWPRAGSAPTRTTRSSSS